MGRTLYRTFTTQGGKCVKIVYIITRADAIGGAQVHVKDLASFFKEQGHEVTILVGGTGAFTDKLHEIGISFISLKHLIRPIKPFKEFLALREIVNTLRHVRPDIISLHSSKAGWLGRLAAKWLQIPVVFTAHGWAFTEGVPDKKRFVYRWVEKLAAPFANKIITVSDYDRNLALKYKIVPQNKITTIHNGMPDIDKSLLANPGINPVHIIMVARFEEQKDHLLLLNALSEIMDLEWTVEFVGDGPLARNIYQKANDLGIISRIQFVGARNDVAERLTKSQIFVLTSNWEGLPRTIIEAMRAGLPIIATDVGGVKEEVIDSVTGYLVSRGDKLKLKERLKELILDSNKRIKLGSAGRKRYEELFTFDRMAKATFGVYQEVINNKISKESN